MNRPCHHEITRYKTRIQKANLNTASFDLEGRLWFTGQTGSLAVLEPERGEIVSLESPRGRVHTEFARLLLGGSGLSHLPEVIVVV